MNTLFLRLSNTFFYWVKHTWVSHLGNWFHIKWYDPYTCMFWSDKLLEECYEHSLLNTLTLTLLLGETHVGFSLWKWIPHKVVGSACVSPNKEVNVEKRVLLIWSNDNQIEWSSRYLTFGVGRSPPLSDNDYSGS